MKNPRSGQSRTGPIRWRSASPHGTLLTGVSCVRQPWQYCVRAGYGAYAEAYCWPPDATMEAAWLLGVSDNLADLRRRCRQHALSQTARRPACAYPEWFAQDALGDLHDRNGRVHIYQLGDEYTAVTASGSQSGRELGSQTHLPTLLADWRHLWDLVPVADAGNWYAVEHHLDSALRRVSQRAGKLDARVAYRHLLDRANLAEDDWHTAFFAGAARILLNSATRQTWLQMADVLRRQAYYQRDKPHLAAAGDPGAYWREVAWETGRCLAYVYQDYLVDELPRTGPGVHDADRGR